MDTNSSQSQTRDLDWIENGKLRLGVSRKGAEMLSLQARDRSGTWHGFLFRDGDSTQPSQGWANHATVMGYYLHRLLGESTHYRGRIIRGGNHGFLRNLEMRPPERSPHRLAYLVTPEDIPPDAYPLRVSMELSYTLTEESLEVEFLFTNHEEHDTAHVSFGLHPGFAVDSPLTCDVTFPPGRYVRHWAPGNFLDGRTEVLDFEGGSMPLDRQDLPGSYLLELRGVPNPIFSISDGGRTVELDFRGVPYLTVWSDLGGFLCLEPCWGLPDSKPQKPFEQKTGIQTIAPSAQLHASFKITPGFIP